MIEYRKGSIFSAEKTVRTWFAHACNAQGVWGAGVARGFREKYQREFLTYQEFCQRHTDANDAVGRGLLAGRIVCLITSGDYGPRHDGPDAILEATDVALREAMRIIGRGEIHMPKINSGLFEVPWEKTAAVIENVMLSFPHIKVIVWELQ